VVDRVGQFPLNGFDGRKLGGFRAGVRTTRRRPSSRISSGVREGSLRVARLEGENEMDLAERVQTTSNIACSSGSATICQQVECVRRRATPRTLTLGNYCGETAPAAPANERAPRCHRCGGNRASARGRPWITPARSQWALRHQHVHRLASRSHEQAREPVTQRTPSVAAPLAGAVKKEYGGCGRLTGRFPAAATTTARSCPDTSTDLTLRHDGVVRDVTMLRPLPWPVGLKRGPSVGSVRAPMLPAPLQFILAMIAYAINPRMAR
jgi:hypothetical protein